MTESQIFKNNDTEVLDSLSTTLDFLKDIMTDDVAENIASSLAGIMTIGKELSDEKINSEIISILRKSNEISDILSFYSELREEGILDILKGFMYGAKSLKDMLNDEAIEKLGNYISITLESLPKIDQFLSMAFDEVPMAFMKALNSEKLKEEIKGKERVTNKDLIAAFNDPATKKGLLIFLLAMREMGKSI
ncbi:hypothetical protein [Sulfuracidifex metallicus]|uniref:hypothetical protein n=1 Tax=Sulfuracidifex metallicus TaxID=47303 RepID=UPI0022763E35|nr:hypothetical protein [Sulfuracidifex metallicus]MCY0849448.1 hypothetical protein [Sulfuracidifex metallicus]